MRMRRQLAMVLLLAGWATGSMAHPVTPSAELRPAIGGAPAKTRQVRVESLGALGLAKEFKALKGRELRARRITILPGGSVAWHEHHQRPGVAYMLSGTLVEYREDNAGVRAIERRAGDAVFESSGVLHGWRNTSSTKATAVVIDLVPQGD